MFEWQVAAQIVEFYKSALKVLEAGDVLDCNTVAEVAGTKTYKSWKKYTQFKMAFYQCLSLLYMGIHCEELQKMGDRLAYFQVPIHSTFCTQLDSSTSLKIAQGLFKACLDIEDFSSLKDSWGFCVILKDIIKIINGMIAIPFLDSFRFVSEMVRHQRQSRQRERERERERLKI